MNVNASVEVPGDKSISHRALMLSALASGVSTLNGVLRSADVASTASVLRALGATIEDNGSVVTVHGRGLRGLAPPVSDLDCGNSGTTTRLMCGIVAAHPFAARFTGDASLSRRPMRRVAEPLVEMGASFEFEDGDGLPLTVNGADLHSIGWRSRSASAQVKSAILLAALNAQVPAAVTEPSRSRDHTERMLSARGVELTQDHTTVSIGVARSLPPCDMTVPGDPSSAAFFLALAALLPAGSSIRVTDICLNPTRTGFIDVLERMGARVERDNLAVSAGELCGDVTVLSTGALRGVAVGPDEIPSMIDEVPVLACLAARAHGVTAISGARELRVKESDRLAAVATNLQSLGVEVQERPDGLLIEGADGCLRGPITTHGDHRLAMAFGILGALRGNDLVIDDPACVAVSYPNFWKDLSRVTQ